jgi:hypothetical protein
MSIGRVRLSQSLDRFFRSGIKLSIAGKMLVFNSLICQV